MASQHTGGLFCWKSWLRFAAHRHLTSNANTPFSRAAQPLPLRGVIPQLGI
jgi:hypothetical protein